MRYPITASARNTKRFVVVFFLNFLLFTFDLFFFFFFSGYSTEVLRRVEVVNRRCSSCVLIDAYKVLECGQHLNQSMVPLMFKRPRSFRVSPINLPSLRETTLSLGVASSSAYLSSLALLSISLTFSSSLPLSLLFHSAHPLFSFPLCRTSL